MFSISDSLLLMLVGLLNFFGAVLLARIRARDETVPLPVLAAAPPRVETARG